MTGWDSIEESTENADYVKLESGKDAVLHVLDKEPVSIFKHFVQAEKKYYKCKNTDNCPYCMKPDASDKLRKFAINVFNLSQKKVQILEQGKQVFGQMKKILEVWKDLDRADLVVKKSGTGIDTEYTVVAVPTSFRPEMAKGQEKFDLTKTYSLKNPDQEEIAGSALEEPGYL